MTPRTIVLSTLGFTACLTTIAASTVLYPDCLKPLIALGLPTDHLKQIPVVGDAILAAKTAQISPKELQMLQQYNEIILIDIRTTAEFDRSHIPGAIHVPLRDIEDGSGIKFIESLQQRSKKIVTYGYSGPRSYRAIDRLKQARIQAIHLAGGITSWGDTMDPNLMVTSSPKQ
jgi:phage shock protein E